MTVSVRSGGLRQQGWGLEGVWEHLGVTHLHAGDSSKLSLLTNVRDGEAWSDASQGQKQSTLKGLRRSD